MDIKNFIIDNIDRILEYLKQNPLYIYARRSVDAYLAAYSLAASLGETAQVAVVDWPPQVGICIGFKCEGLYITERGIGLDDKVYTSDFTSMSHIVAHIITSLSPLEEDVYKALFIGHYSWSVDYCEYKCPPPRELNRGDEKLAIVFPFVGELPANKALPLSTLPIIPGVTGREFDSVPEDEIRLLDWALGAVASEGFHTAILDKAVRYYSPEIKAADVAERLEADLANFIDKGVEVYVSNLAENFYMILKKVKEDVIPVQNPFYIYKIPPYLSYYMKLANYVALKYDAPRGYVIALIPPFGEKAQLKTVASALAELGQVLEFPTHIVAYIESNKYTDFLREYERIKK
ncbi:hypothetical protein PAE3484 [Pyrobaculum aerophilum str. IM2]|uniref:Uncharacterized protein n=2 Tax=Pyrobaculum aerophilum TaxID=13773 RepID=Q8ZT12_PYRAE|nr:MULTISPECIES: hypothetical protein [Pyrobaculum]AAL64951.1 hypothetical protein PAE3484 [Pyrobaculum aerophilum str. IM2]HII46580.1 hypothetical protein [Pyrobaculum aerophilum]